MTEATKTKHELPADASFHDLTHWLAERACDEFHTAVLKPFWRDGWAYFTDGRILIRLRCEGLPDDLDHKRFENGKWSGVDEDKGPRWGSSRTIPPATDQVISQMSPDTVLDPPAVEGPEDEWDAKWRFEDECESCHGLGSVECDMGHDHDCNECEGKGRATGQADEAARRSDFHGRDFQRFYLWIISQLPSVKLSKPSEDKMGILSFRFAGGEGLLCALSEDR